MNVTCEARWRRIASGSAYGFTEITVRAFLVPCALLYGWITAVRAWLYRSGAFRAGRLPRPVISVGNITVGGTGKTPVTAYLARLLITKGARVAVLSRGYGGSLAGSIAIVSDGTRIYYTAQECGDEPCLLASTIPGLIVVVGADRHAAGLLAMEQLRPDVFLLDDGFQHLRLHRDLNILLLDARRPFGNGWCLPAGLLREQWQAALRSDLVIMTRCLSEAAKPVCLPADHPCFISRHVLRDLVPLVGGTACPFAVLAGRKVMAFAGIASPELFFNELEALGMDVVARVGLPDHAKYDQQCEQLLYDTMTSSGAECAVTTEKDGVKLSDLPAGLAAVTFLARLELALEHPELLESMVTSILPVR